MQSELQGRGAHRAHSIFPEKGPANREPGFGLHFRGKPETGNRQFAFSP